MNMVIFINILLKLVLRLWEQLASDHEKSCKHIIVYVLDISEWLYQTLFKVSAHFYFQAFYCELSPGRAMVCSH